MAQTIQFRFQTNVMLSTQYDFIILIVGICIICVTIAVFGTCWLLPRADPILIGSVFFAAPFTIKTRTYAACCKILYTWGGSA